MVLSFFYLIYNVKFCETRAVRGFRRNVLLNAFYYFSFVFLLFSVFDAVAFMLLLFFCFYRFSLLCSYQSVHLTWSSAEAALFAASAGTICWHNYHFSFQI